MNRLWWNKAALEDQNLFAEQAALCEQYGIITIKPLFETMVFSFASIPLLAVRWVADG